MEGIVFEVRRGEGPWVALPPCARDTRLCARAAAPADAKDLLGTVPAGAWGVRQKAGGAYPHRVRIEFTLRGDPLLVKDLRVADLALPDLDAKPVVGRPHHPDRVGNPVLRPGAAVKAVVTVENCGARRTKASDIDLVVAPPGQRQGRRIAFAQCEALEPGKSATATLEGRIPEDLDLKPGILEIVAVVNPRGVEREVETWNNALGRAFRFEVPPPREPLPGDLRDR
jgi:hypothetical protein